MQPEAEATPATPAADVGWFSKRRLGKKFASLFVRLVPVWTLGTSLFAKRTGENDADGCVCNRRV